MKIVTPSRNRRLILPLVGALLIIGFGLTGYWYYQTRNQQSPTDQTINFGPPTETEKRETEDHKKEILANNNPVTPSGSNGVTPVITNAQQLDRQVTVNAYVPKVIENDGTCTVTFTKQNTTLTKEVGAFADAAYTNCRPLRVDRSEFKDVGTWSVVVSYKSKTVSGDSQPKNLEIQ